MPGRDLVVTYSGDTTGADAASAKTRSQLDQTASSAEQMSKRFEAASKRAGASGRAIGDGLLKSVSKATGSTILKGAGGAIGTGIANAVGRQIAQTPLFQKLQAKAGIAGQQAGEQVAKGLQAKAAPAGEKAGAKVATGIERQAGKVNWNRLKTPALIGAALGLGLLFGRRFGNSAESSARSSFHPTFSLGGLSRGLKYAALGAGAAVGAALGGAIAKGGARLDAIDAAQGKLRGLGNDAKTTTQIMNDALAAVKGTAFGLDEAATVSATAVAAGIKPGKELQRTLKLVADTATIGNTSLGESGAIFNKVATSNKVYNDTLNQLGDRGIPIVQLLGKQMGKSSDEVTKLASKGKIDFKTFQAALENGLGGAALKSGDTFQGALKNAKSAVGRFGAGLLSGAFPQLKGVFGDVTKALDSATPTAKRVGKTLGNVFSDVVGLVKGAAPIFKSLGTIAAGVFKPFVKSLGGGKGAIKGLTDYVTSHQGDIVSFFVSAGHSAIAFAKAAAGGVLGAIGVIRGLNTAVEVALVGITMAASDMARALAVVARPVNPALANSLEGVAGKLDDMGAHAQVKAKAMDDSLAAAGQGITDKLMPALDAADAGLTKVGNQEIGKAAQRDAAAKTAQAVAAIGTAANGSQIHLKRWSDVSKLGASAQGELKSRIKSAQGALSGQIDAQRAAGAGQKALTKTWETGRDRLAGEFRQMGLSRREAGRLADKYAGVKPKVKTTFSTPGLPGAKSGTDNYKGSLSNVPGRKSTKFSTPGLNDAYNRARGLDTTLRNIPKNIQIKINQSVATKGDRLAANRHAGGVWNGPDTVIKAASGRVLPGWSPGRDIHRFYSATAGELDLSGGEAIMRPEFTRAVGGAVGVDRLNRQAQDGTLARGLATGGVPSLVALPAGPNSTPASARRSDSALTRADVDRLVAALSERQGGATVEVVPDYRGIVNLVRAEISEAARKRPSA